MGLYKRFLAIAGIAALVMSASIPLSALVPKEEVDSLDSLVKVDERLRPSSMAERLEDTWSLLAPKASAGWQKFLGAAGVSGQWSAYVDRRTGYVESVEGSGIPWIPGRGNRLARADLSSRLAGRSEIDLPVLESLARDFLPEVAPAMGIEPAALVLNRGRSGRFGDALWFVDFDVYRGGLPIEGARVVFRVSHGNLVQFGTENLPSSGVAAPKTRLSRDEARARLSSYVGGLRASDRMIDPGSLHLLPAALDGGGSRGLVRVWQITFRRDGEGATWQARIDAATGKVLELYDINEYAQIIGGAYPVSPYFADETLLPMPFADAGGGYTDSAGLYSYTSGAVASTLNGRYVRINDSCGAISMAGDSSGNVSFGTAAGSDCNTAGFGGTGNTHSARTQFYHVNRAKEAGRTWLPGNAWLNNPLANPLVVNVNISPLCNASWNGSVLRFYRSVPSSCGNTGEIAAVSLHEYGHGLDQNDGNGSSPDKGTGETYGDFTAALALRTSCIGDGFRTVKCSGYGDACLSCTGVRDIDWAKHASMTAHTVANFTQPRCPASSVYQGPCGKEGHCESYVSSEALWDFAARDLLPPNSNTSWAVAERLWYVSRPTATKAFSCNTGSTTWASDGCAIGSLWKTFRIADDDNGNLSDGTPHSSALFAAFNRHGIACPTDTGASVDHVTCIPPAVPALTVTLTAGVANLSWTSSGTGTVYDVYRKEAGGGGFVKAANDLAALTYSEPVANGLTYTYQVIAHPFGKEECSSAPTAPASITSPAPTDVWSQDNPADTGSTPVPGDMWKSDDIWVNTLTAGGSHQDPEFGSTNYVHVKVRNAGPGTAYGVHVQMYWADANIGLSWPADWHSLGTYGIPSLASGTMAEAVLPWLPAHAGHFCLVARLVTAQDPMTTSENTDIDHNVRNNNNIVWKNVNVVDLLPFVITPDMFTIANSSLLDGIFRLSLREAAKPRQAPLLDCTRLTLKLPENLFQRWTAAKRPGQGVRLLPGHYLEITSPQAYIDLPLKAGERFMPCLTFELDPAAAGAPPTRFWFEIAMDRLGENSSLIPVGGIAWDLHVGGEPVDAFVTVANEVSGTFEEGGLVTYTLTLNNSGDDAQMDNPGDELRDVLPAEIADLSVKASSGRVQLAGRTVTWNGLIRAHKSVTLTVKGRILQETRGRTVANQAQAFYDEDNNGTNEATANSDDPATPVVRDATVFQVKTPGIPLTDRP
jgi:hypothetical protein